MPLSLDVKFVILTARQLVRHHASPTVFFRGPDGLNGLLTRLYAENPVGLVHTFDFDILLDPNDMGVSPSIAVLGWHELRTTEFFLDLLHEGSTVIDVGANVGYFTLLAAKLVGDSGTVLAFEPEPTCFSLLSRSVQKNGFRNVKPFPQCVSDIDGEQTLHLSVTRNKGLHSISRDLGGQTIRVPSTRLDTIGKAQGLRSVDLLKIDAEGAEPEVLKGAAHLLESGKVRNVIMEWEHPESWAGHEDLIDMIFSKFDLYRFSRSLPFVPAKRLVSGATGLFDGKFGANVYLQSRNRPNP